MTGRVFDASTAIPEKAPDGCEGVLGYIGKTTTDGRKLDYATHVWTLQQWLRFEHLRQFPCWPLSPATDPDEQGDAAAEAAAALGWHKGRLIIGDEEASKDAARFAKWAARVESHGYRSGWYGSAGYAASYDCEFKILARPDGIETIPDGFEGKQYQWDVHVPGGVVDLSVFSHRLMEHGGVGPRH